MAPGTQLGRCTRTLLCPGAGGTRKGTESENQPTLPAARDAVVDQDHVGKDAASDAAQAPVYIMVFLEFVLGALSTAYRISTYRIEGS
jgi:hypothetical protein